MYTLSYILATYNRLPFLKITLSELFKALQDTEEIVVVDGCSDDGTKEYLQELFLAGKIHQFISEPDRNQAHGWNKALLMARGTIIKKIIDDDVFCYSAIQKCKNYMLLNDKIDIIISNDLSTHLDNHGKIEEHSRLPQFQQWKSGLVPSFTFGDVHMLVRRSSLPLVGLYKASFIMIDWEYSLRASHLGANIGFYTGYNALSVYHHESISNNVNQKEIALQGNYIRKLYEYKGDNAELTWWSRIKIFIGRQLNKTNDIPLNLDEQDIVTVYKDLYHSLQAKNDTTEAIFII